MSADSDVKGPPDNWTRRRLGDVVALSNDSGIPTEEPNIPFVGMEHIEAQTGRLLSYGDPVDYKSSSYIVDSSQVLYGRLRPYLNKVFVPKERCYASREFIPMVLTKDIDQAFLLYLLRSSGFVEFAISLNTGDRPRVKWPQMATFEIALPPLDEQLKIVEILEEQLSRLDAALASVRAVREKSERFRRSLLHGAFTGALTGHCLTSEVFPVGWSQCVLGDVVSLKSGFAYKSQDWVDDGVAVIKIANVRNGKVALDGCSYVTDEVAGETADFEVLDGDLLLTLTGEIGAIGIYKEHHPARLNQRVARIDLKQEGEHIFRYLCLFLESPQARDLMWSKAQGMAQPNISPKEVLQIPFPLAPFDEQVKIVEILEEQLSRLDASLAIVDVIEKKASALRRTLLHAAFSGNLTKEWREGADV